MSAQLLADMLEGLQHVEFEGNDVCLLAPEDRDEIVAALRAQGWRPIAEAPKDGTKILTTTAAYWPQTSYWMRAPDMLRWNGYAKDDQPTLWQPLPAPPTERAK